MIDPLTITTCEHCGGTGHREYVTPSRIERLACEVMRTTGRPPRIARLGARAKEELLSCFTGERFRCPPCDPYVHTSVGRVFVVLGPGMGAWEVVVE